MAVTIMQANALARSSTRNILARSRISLSSRYADAFPGPTGASPSCADNADISTTARDGAGDTIQSQTGDRDASGGRSGESVAVGIVLINGDAVTGDAAEGNTGVCDVLHRARRRTRHDLDPDAVQRVLDAGVRDDDVFDGVIRAATNRSDRQAMATRAKAVGERDVGARVDGYTVILVVNLGRVNVYSSG